MFLSSLADIPHLQCKSELVKHVCIIHTLQSVASALVEVAEGVSWLQEQLFHQLWAGHCTSNHLVEDMVVAFLWRLEGDT